MPASLFLALGVLSAPLDHACIDAGGSVFELLPASENSNCSGRFIPNDSDFLREQAKRVSLSDSGVL